MNIVKHLKQRDQVHVKWIGDTYTVVVKLDDNETIFLPKALVDAINDVVRNSYVDLTRIEMDGQIND